MAHPVQRRVIRKAGGENYYWFETDPINIDKTLLENLDFLGYFFDIKHTPQCSYEDMLKISGRKIIKPFDAIMTN